MLYLLESTMLVGIFTNLGAILSVHVPFFEFNDSKSCFF